MAMIHYAIGDVHGRDDLLETMLEHIASDRERRHPDSEATMVFVGDYVDRGPDSAAVIDRLMGGVDGFDLVCLKGNHEAMMLACTETDDRQAWAGWIHNGGDATIHSFGLDIRFGYFSADHLVEAVRSGLSGSPGCATCRFITAHRTPCSCMRAFCQAFPWRNSLNATCCGSATGFWTATTITACWLCTATRRWMCRMSKPTGSVSTPALSAQVD